MAPAVHENYRPRALHGCEWHEALNVHAMNPVLSLIHCKPHLLMSIPKRTTGAIRFVNNRQPEGVRNFRHHVCGVWRRWLSRRSQRACMSWEVMNRLLQYYPLPQPHISSAVT